MTNHTPTPLHLLSSHSLRLALSSADYTDECIESIVRAVNAYERDQEIIRAFADYDCDQPDGIGCERFGEKYGAGSPTCWPCKARQAIAKAE